MPTKEELEKEVDNAGLALMGVLSNENMKALQKVMDDGQKKFGEVKPDNINKDILDKNTVYLYDNIPSSFNENERKTTLNFINALRNRESLPPLPKSNNMLMIIIILLLLLGGGAAFFFMKKSKAPSPMTAFGKKLAKILKV